MNPYINNAFSKSLINEEVQYVFFVNIIRYMYDNSRSEF